MLASTTDTHHDSFAKISEGDHISVPERWARYDFTVPEGTRYVAVRCIYRKVMLFIDDFTYTPYGGMPADAPCAATTCTATDRR